MSTRRAGGDEFREFRQRVCAWLRDNGIDPGEIPENAPMSYAHGRLTYERIIRGPHGQLPVTSGRLDTRTITVEIGRPPWLS